MNKLWTEEQYNCICNYLEEQNMSMENINGIVDNSMNEPLMEIYQEVVDELNPVDTKEIKDITKDFLGVDINIEELMKKAILIELILDLRKGVANQTANGFETRIFLNEGEIDNRQDEMRGMQYEKEYLEPFWDVLDLIKEKEETSNWEEKDNDEDEYDEDEEDEYEESVYEVCEDEAVIVQDKDVICLSATISDGKRNSAKVHAESKKEKTVIPFELGRYFRKKAEGLYYADEVYARLVAAMVKDSRLIECFEIAQNGKDGHGYRHKSLKEVRGGYDSIIEMFEIQDDPLKENIHRTDGVIWAEEITCYNAIRIIYSGLRRVFKIFPCNYRNLKFDDNGCKQFEDEKTVQFWTVVQTIISYFVKINSQCIRLYMAKEFEKQCVILDKEIHSRNEQDKDRVIKFLGEWFWFLHILLHMNITINEIFRLHLNLFACIHAILEQNGRKDSIRLSDELDKLGNILETELLNESIREYYEGNDLEERRNVDKESGKDIVLCDKIIRATFEMHYTMNSRSVYLKRRIKKLIPDSVFNKLRKNRNKERAVAKYKYEGTDFYLVQINIEWSSSEVTKDDARRDIANYVVFGFLHNEGEFVEIKRKLEDFLDSDAKLVEKKIFRFKMIKNSESSDATWQLIEKS